MTYRQVRGLSPDPSRTHHRLRWLPRCAPREQFSPGFTLIELMVAMAVVAFLAVGASTLLLNQQRAFRMSADDRTLQEGARVALSEIGMNLRRAGYGVDPWFAFDFGPVTATRLISDSTPYSYLSYQGGPPGGTRIDCASTPVACRDSAGSMASTDGSDEIVFYSRSPAFSRMLSAAPSSTTLRFTEPLANSFDSGQILQLMCGGAADWTYVTVASTASDKLSVTLDTSRSGVFPYQQDRITSGSCFIRNYATAAIFRVDRFHYFVATYTDPAHPAGRPYLMLDRGLGSAEPVSPDVEDIQFTYVFRSGTLAGNVPGTRLANSASGIHLSVALHPRYDDATTASTRSTNSPGNIMGVRVSVVIRSPSYDSQLTNTADRTLPAAGNRANLVGPAGYRRLLVETSETTFNLDSRGAFMPPFSVNSGADGLNVGGG